MNDDAERMGPVTEDEVSHGERTPTRYYCGREGDGDATGELTKGRGQAFEVLLWP